MKKGVYLTDGNERQGPFAPEELFIHFEEAAEFSGTAPDPVTSNFFNLLYGAALISNHKTWEKDRFEDEPSGFVDVLFLMKSFQQAFEDWKYRGRHTAFGLPREIEIGTLQADFQAMLKSVRIDSVREIFGIYCLRLQSEATVAPKYCDVAFSLRLMLRCLDNEDRFRSCIENRPDDIF